MFIASVVYASFKLKRFTICVEKFLSFTLVIGLSWRCSQEGTIPSRNWIWSMNSIPSHYSGQIIASNFDFFGDANGWERREQHDTVRNFMGKFIFIVKTFIAFFVEKAARDLVLMILPSTFCCPFLRSPIAYWDVTISHPIANYKFTGYSNMNPLLRVSLSHILPRYFDIYLNT